MPSKAICFAIVACFQFASTSRADGDVYVHGHPGRHGSYVRPHMRSAPDGDFRNNWSTRGNVNPYTGKQGWMTNDPNLGRMNLNGFSGSTARSYSVGASSPAGVEASVNSWGPARQRADQEPAKPRQQSTCEKAAEFAKKGFDYFKANNFERAVAEYTSAIRECPNADFYYCRGSMLLRLGRLDEAIDDLNIAIAMRPTFDTAHQALRTAYAWKGNPRYTVGSR